MHIIICTWTFAGMTSYYKQPEKKTGAYSIHANCFMAGKTYIIIIIAVTNHKHVDNNTRSGWCDLM